MTSRAQRQEAKKPGRALARPGDPLATVSGKIVTDNKSKRRGEFVALAKPTGKDYRPTKRRSIKELPATPQMFNAISVLMMYTLLGLSDREIMDTLKITEVEMESIRNHSGYNECFDALMAEFINSESELIQSRIAAYQHSALDTVAELAHSAKQEAVQFKAADSLLTRGAENTAAGAAKKTEFRIVILDDQRDVNLNININP